MRRTFSSLHYRNYRLFFFGQAISQIGIVDAADRAQLVRPATDARRLVRGRDHGRRAVPAVHPVRALRRRVHGPARRAPPRGLDAGLAARHRGRARVDRARRLRAAVDAVHDRVRERGDPRARRAVPPAAHVSHGRPGYTAERDRAQLEPLQRVAHLRPIARRRDHRLRRRRRLLHRERDQLRRRPARPLRDAHERVLPGREVRAPGDPARHARRALVRAQAAADADRARADARPRAPSASTST